MHLTYAADQLDYRSGLRVSPTASSSSSGLPISGERHITSATRSVPISSTAKRPRLGLDDGSHLSQSASATLNHNSNHIGGSGSPTFPFRLDVDLPSSYSTVIPSLPHLHSPHPSLNALYPGGSMPGMISAPPSFLSNSPFDLSRPSQQQQQPLRSVTYAQSTPSHYSPTGHQHPPSIFSRAAGGQGGGGAGGAGEGAGFGSTVVVLSAAQKPSWRARPLAMRPCWNDLCTR